MARRKFRTLQQAACGAALHNRSGILLTAVMRLTDGSQRLIGNHAIHWCQHSPAIVNQVSKVNFHLLCDCGALKENLQLVSKFSISLSKSQAMVASLSTKNYE
jgi:hypothetical protein